MNFYQIVFSSLQRSFTQQEDKGIETPSAALVFSFIQLLNIQTLFIVVRALTGFNAVELFLNNLKLAAIAIGGTIFLVNLTYLYAKGRHKVIMDNHAALSKEMRERYKRIAIIYGVASLVLFFAFPLLFF